MSRFAKQLAEFSGDGNRTRSLASFAEDDNYNGSTKVSVKIRSQGSSASTPSSSSALYNSRSPPPAPLHSSNSSLHSIASFFSSSKQRSERPTTPPLPPGLSGELASHSRHHSSQTRKKHPGSVGSVRWVDEASLADMQARSPPANGTTRRGGLRKKPGVMIPSRHGSLPSKLPISPQPKLTPSPTPSTSSSGTPPPSEPEQGQKRRPSFGMVKRKPVPIFLKNEEGEREDLRSRERSSSSPEETSERGRRTAVANVAEGSSLRPIRDASVDSTPSSTGTMLTAIEGDWSDDEDVEREPMYHHGEDEVASRSSASLGDTDDPDTTITDKTLRAISAPLDRENSRGSGSVFIENFSRSPTLEIGRSSTSELEEFEASPPPPVRRSSSLARVMRSLSLRRNGSGKSSTKGRGTAKVSGDDGAESFAERMSGEGPLASRALSHSLAPAVAPPSGLALGTHVTTPSDSTNSSSDSNATDSHNPKLTNVLANSSATTSSPPLVPVPFLSATPSPPNSQPEQRVNSSSFLSRFLWISNAKSLGVNSPPSPQLSTSSSPSLNASPLNTPHANEALSPLPNHSDEFSTTYKNARADVPAKPAPRSPKFNPLSSLMAISDKLTGSGRDETRGPIFLGLNDDDDDRQHTSR